MHFGSNPCSSDERPLDLGAMAIILADPNSCVPDWYAAVAVDKRDPGNFGSSSEDLRSYPPAGLAR